MATAWLTYAWEDNKSGDVDFMAQELVAAGIQLKLDRWNLTAGRRLWDQIAGFIQSDAQSDAWLLYATPASLGSEPCREEYSYALGRALKTRGEKFPVIAVFPAPVDDALIPPGIANRLYVSLTDPDWKERIVAAVQNRASNPATPIIAPYEVRMHQQVGGASPFVIEVRPRAGTWAPFIVGVPAVEKDIVRPGIMRAARGRVPSGAAFASFGEGITEPWWYFLGDEATPTQSCYLFCQTLPTKLLFGAEHGPQYQVTLSQQTPSKPA
jgi:hypothetical protein